MNKLHVGFGAKPIIRQHPFNQDMIGTVEEIGLLYRVKIHHQAYLTNQSLWRTCFGRSI